MTRARRQAHERSAGRARRGYGLIALAVVAVGAASLLGALSLGRPSGAGDGQASRPTGGPSVGGQGGAPGQSASPTDRLLLGSAAPSSAVVPPAPAPAHTAGAAPSGRLGLGLLIADRGNGRLLIVDPRGAVLWRFPGPGSLPAGQAFAADDAFLAPDGRSIVANDEAHQVVDRIDVATRRVVWQYGHYGRAGSAPGYLHTPDDAYPLAGGDIVVADISNCRVLEISPARRVVRQWGRTGACYHRPPLTYAQPNGDTPLPDGGLLITEIGGSHVTRLDARGRVLFSIRVPVAYPSDAQLEPNGDVLVVDYSSPGAVVEVDPRGRVVWRYRVASGPGRLDHPSLAVPLADGTIAVNDDFRARVVVIDPRTDRIIWQYGHTGVAGRRPGYLSIPDGIDVIPLGTSL